MSDEVIPQDVQQFILQNIDSIAQLEGLLLLRNDSSVEWNAAVLSHRLYISEAETSQLLAQLEARDILSSSGGKRPAYRYAPKSPDLDEMIGRLAELYARYLVPVTNIVHSKPKSRIQEFSDAFWLRKD